MTWHVHQPLCPEDPPTGRSGQAWLLARLARCRWVQPNPAATRAPLGKPNRCLTPAYSPARQTDFRSGSLEVSPNRVRIAASMRLEIAWLVRGPYDQKAPSRAVRRFRPRLGHPERNGRLRAYGPP